MWNTVFLTAALALGQPGDPLPDIAPATPPSLKAPAQSLPAPPASLFKSISITADSPAPVQAPALAAPPAPADVPPLLVSAPAEPPPPADQPPAPVLITAPLLPHAAAGGGPPAAATPP